MVGGALIYLRSLRRFKDDAGWIKTLLDEAENERMHLMIFLHVARPNWFERFLIVLAQGVFYNAFFLLYCGPAAVASYLVIAWELRGGKAAATVAP